MYSDKLFTVFITQRKLAWKRWKVKQLWKKSENKTAVGGYRVHMANFGSIFLMTT